MTKSKKEWVTPELIVLVRSKPEEAVLRGCKLGVAGIIQPNSGKSRCYRTSNCTATKCSAIVHS
jgi:hypothetical protein